MLFISSKALSTPLYPCHGSVSARFTFWLMAHNQTILEIVLYCFPSRFPSRYYMFLILSNHHLHSSRNNIHMHYNSLRLCRGGISESSVLCCGSQKYIFIDPVQVQEQSCFVRKCISFLLVIFNHIWRSVCILQGVYSIFMFLEPREK